MADTPAAGLIVFDMDSTLIQIECIDEIASLTGAGDEVAAITERAMRGELDFEQSLRARVSCLKGVSVSQFQSLFDPIPFTPGVHQLIQTLRAQGWKTALVSGGFTWFAEQVASQLQLDWFAANELEQQQGVLTGTVGTKIVDARFKAQTVIDLKRRWQIESGRTIAVGDGANDRDMLQAADIGVAFCAKPTLKEVADICIDDNDLSLLLPLLQQGGLLQAEPVG